MEAIELDRGGEVLEDFVDGFAVGLATGECESPLLVEVIVLATMSMMRFGRNGDRITMNKLTF